MFIYSVYKEKGFCCQHAFAQIWGLCTYLICFKKKSNEELVSIWKLCSFQDESSHLWL